MSMVHTLQSLTEAENTSSMAPGNDIIPGCALWVLEGMEIESLQ
jgi:hypothetical protein